MALKDLIVHPPNCPFHTFTEHLRGIRHSVHPHMYVHFQTKNGKTKLKEGHGWARDDNGETRHRDTFMKVCVCIERGGGKEERREGERERRNKEDSHWRDLCMYGNLGNDGMAL